MENMNEWDSVCDHYIRTNKPKIIGFFGKMGCGKTMLMTGFGLYHANKGTKIYSNYHLKNIDYTPITNIDDLQKMHDGVALLDELWIWLNARRSSRKLNIELSKIVFLNRKRGMTLYFTAQLYRQIDILIKEVTDLVIHPSIRPFNDQNGNIEYRLSWFWEDPYTSLNHPCDELGRPKGFVWYDKPLSYLGSFYDTKQEIGELNKKENSPLIKGIGLESDFYKAIQKVENINFSELLQNSGMGSHWPCDIIAYTDNNVLCFDVKGNNGERVYIDDCTRLKDQKDIASKHSNARFFIATPDKDRKQLSRSDAWFIHEIDRNTYLNTIKSRPYYNKFIKKSMKLTNLA